METTIVENQLEKTMENEMGDYYILGSKLGNILYYTGSTLSDSLIPY